MSPGTGFLEHHPPRTARDGKPRAQPPPPGARSGNPEQSMPAMAEQSKLSQTHPDAEGEHGGQSGTFLNEQRPLNWNLPPDPRDGLSWPKTVE